MREPITGRIIDLQEFAEVAQASLFTGFQNLDTRGDLFNNAINGIVNQLFGNDEEVARLIAERLALVGKLDQTESELTAVFDEIIARADARRAALLQGNADLDDKPPSISGTDESRDDGTVDRINKRIAALELERDAIGKTHIEIELLKLARAGANEADLDRARAALESIAAYKTETDVINEQADAAEQLAETEINNRNATLDRIATLREEIENFGKSRLELAALNEEKRLGAETDQTRIQQAVDLAVQYEKLLIAREEETRTIEERNRALEAEQRRIDDLATALASNLTSSFEDAVFAGASFGNVLTALADDMARLIFRITVLEPLANSLADAFGRGKKGGGVVGLLTSLAGSVAGGVVSGGASGSASSLGFGGSDPLGLSGINAANVIPLEFESLGRFQHGGVVDSVLARLTENGGDKLVHGSGGISQPRAE